MWLFRVRVGRGIPHITPFLTRPDRPSRLLTLYRLRHSAWIRSIVQTMPGEEREM